MAYGKGSHQKVPAMEETRIMLRDQHPLIEYHDFLRKAPRSEVKGSTTLPLSRVKKVLATDDEINSVSANAAFAITIATELFIRYLTEQAMNVVKAERKPRKVLQYRDLANAVSRNDNLNFLDDIVPRTTTYKEYKARKKGVQENTALDRGQTTLDMAHAGSRKGKERERPTEEDGANDQIQRESGQKTDIGEAIASAAPVTSPKPDGAQDEMTETVDDEPSDGAMDVS